MGVLRGGCGLKFFKHFFSKSSEFSFLWPVVLGAGVVVISQPKARNRRNKSLEGGMVEYIIGKKINNIIRPHIDKTMKISLSVVELDSEGARPPGVGSAVQEPFVPY